MIDSNSLCALITIGVSICGFIVAGTYYFLIRDIGILDYESIIGWKKEDSSLNINQYLQNNKITQYQCYIIERQYRRHLLEKKKDTLQEL